MTINTSNYFAGVVQSPSVTVPLLTNDEISEILVQAIRAYLDKEIKFQTFINIVIKIKEFSGLRDKAAINVDAVLAKSVSLAKFLKNEENKRNDINLTLTDALDNLSKKQ